jgi:hypothetical protein
MRSRLTQFPISVGMLPLTLFPPNPKIFREVMRPMVVGIVLFAIELNSRKISRMLGFRNIPSDHPVKELSLSMSALRLVMFPISAGRVLVKLHNRQLIVSVIKESILEKERKSIIVSRRKTY